MKQYDKPYKTLDELVELLIDKHHLIIYDKDTAKKLLRCIPYYDLINEYKDVFMTQDDVFKPSTSIDMLYTFYLFDKGFQNALFQFSTLVESYFKNILSDIIASHISVSEIEYLDPANYFSSSTNNIDKRYFFNKLKHIKDYTRDHPTIFYRENHNHIPPWILLKNITFSQAINWLSFLPRNTKNDLVDIIIPLNFPHDQRIPVLIYALTIIRRCRNIMAHDLKFISFDCSKYYNNLNKSVLRSLIPQELLTNEELKKNKYLTGIYGYIIFSLVLAPELAIKLKVCSNIVAHVMANELNQNKSLSISWSLTKDRYFSYTHIPSDLLQRLSNYTKREVEKLSPKN